MNPFHFRPLFLSLCVLCAGSSAYAGAGKSVFSFLRLSQGARMAAMGDVSNTLAAQNVPFNPGTLPWVSGETLVFNYNDYVQGVSYQTLSYVRPLKNGAAFGLSAGYLGARGLVRTVAASTIEGYEEKGTFGFSDAVFDLSFGRRISRRISYGMLLRGVRESVDGHTLSGAMLSVGGLYFAGDGGYRVGFGLLNLGPPVKGYDLPSGGYLNTGRLLSPDLYWGAEGVACTDGTAELRTGFEYVLDRHILVRAGYRHFVPGTDLGQFPSVHLTAGLGLYLGKTSLDYAWVPYGDLGQTHRITVTHRL